MTKEEIIEEVARLKGVERIVSNVTRSALNPDTLDLCQMVYLQLLALPEETIADLYRSHALGFYIARVVCNQYHSVTSEYYYTFRRITSAHRQMREEETQTVAPLQELRREYYAEDAEDTDELRKTKQGVAALPTPDETLILLYADLRSYRKVAKVIGMSHTAVAKEIKRIRTNLISKL